MELDESSRQDEKTIDTHRRLKLTNGPPKSLSGWYLRASPRLRCSIATEPFGAATPGMDSWPGRWSRGWFRGRQTTGSTRAIALTAMGE